MKKFITLLVITTVLLASCATAPEPEPEESGPDWSERMDTLIAETAANLPAPDDVDWSQYSGEPIEAESGTFEWAAIESEHVGFTGEGFVNFDNSPGGWLEIPNDVPADGTYLVVANYAHGGGGNRFCSVLLDGTVIKDKLDFVPTGAWTSYIQKGFEADLPAGSHILRFNGDAPEGGPNLDHVFLVAVQ